MTALIKYEAARLALSEARSVDEVKPWIDKSAAMQAYGRMAKDKTLEVDASEIRIRAERRLGELIVAQKKTDGLAKPGVKPTNSVVTNDRIPTLAETGVSKDLSSRAQKLAAVPAETFEAEIAVHRERVSAEGARVSARLAAAGTKAAKPVADESLQARVTELEAELAETREALSDVQEVASSLMRATEVGMQQRHDELMAEIKTIKRTRNDLLNENASLKKQCKQLLRRLGEKP